MAASRLDRLVTLLEKGSTQLIRTTAAEQLADVQKQHPDELYNLLGRVLPYLRSRSWDTRTAAAKAIGGIVSHVPAFDPNADEGEVKHGNAELKHDDAPGKQGISNGADTDLLQLDTLDVRLILKHGKKLLGSAGKEYEYSMAHMDATQRLAYQKKNLTSRLGLGGEYMEDDLLDEMDFTAAASKGSKTSGLARVDTTMRSRKNSISSASPYTATEENGSLSAIEESGLSKRQLNQLKRKSKTAAKAGANKMRVVDLAGRRPFDSVTTPTTAAPHGIKLNGEDEDSDGKTSDYFSVKREASDDDTRIVSEFKGETAPEKPLIQSDEAPGYEWPFEVVCEFLSVDLFDPSWEIRHGASMGLREVLRFQGRGAGRKCGMTRSENDRANQILLDDLACRILCVLMLDRFGDYVSDTVVAPIRESVGQTLGALLTQLTDPTSLSVYQVLQKMISQSDLGLSQPIWEACHGGMIGLRYFVAVRKDLLFHHSHLLDGVTEAVTRGLGHHDDDVKSVSAATLVPITSELVASKPDALGQLILVVWDCLSDMQDDLSASTGAVMDLLANLCSFEEVLQAMRSNASKDPEQSFHMLVPRLYYFLRHTITSVRSAVLRAILTFSKLPCEESVQWVSIRVLRLLFQNILLERNEAVLKLSFEVWSALVGLLKKSDRTGHLRELATQLSPMIMALVQPIGQDRRPMSMDLTLFIKPSGSPMSNITRSSHVATAKSKKGREDSTGPASAAFSTDGHMMAGDVQLVGIEVMFRTKIYGARALGALIASLEPPEQDKAWSVLLSYLDSVNSSSRLAAAMALQEVAKCKSSSLSTNATDTQRLQASLESTNEIWYSDIVSSLQAARGQCQALSVAFRDHARVPQSKLTEIAAICQGESAAGPTAFSLHDAERIVSTDFDRLLKGLTPAQRVTGTQFLNDARAHAKTAVEEARRAKESRDTAINAAVAAVLITLTEIPKKPSSVIKSVMDSIKSEQVEELQQRSGAAIASLIEFYITNSKKALVDKVVTNLVKFCCVDTSESPEFHLNATFVEAILSLRKEEDKKDHPDAARFEQEAKEARVMRRGAKYALEQLVNNYKSDLLSKVPILRSLIEEPLRQGLGGDLPKDILDVDSSTGQAIVDALSILRTLAPSFDASLYSWIQTLVPFVSKGMRSRLSVIRYAAAKCYATLCSVMTTTCMTSLVENVLPDINNALDTHVRQGITECVYHLIHIMEDRILPYVIFLIVPVLGRMSDSNDDVRLLATTSFATLVKLVPLEAGIQDPPGMSATLLQGRDRERRFMAQMLDPKKVEPFQIPVTIKAELRSYQQDGVNWLAFLSRFNLHGVLCDDMGLGKTLQTLCIVASDHHMRAEEYARTKAPDQRPLPSLIVCPPTLSGHWQQEIRQYAPFLKCAAYVGSPAERARVRTQLEKVDIVITSYDVCRNDNDVLNPITWNYCVLDEGHLIKNPKAKITMAVKKMLSNHRLILSGTPIQNNVLELWSLFDFLMPGFLGTEKVFLERFAKPIAASRNAKSSSKEQEAGALAIEALHKQVLPFLLRRLKEEVLNDLPPKILQNYYCDLSDLQKQLFEEFFRKEKKTVEANVGSGEKESKQHIFQALQYMRKLCNSPALVVKEGHKQFSAIQKQLAATNTTLRDISHAPKLTALRDLLIDCGIGTVADANDISVNNYVSQHRALIFCQMKEMLDMVQTEVLGKLLPSVQYLRLDGSVEATKRQNIVNQFNTDPSYDCLLLTTSVGGLGLNLTGADTVIFVEHDWNPQKDIQAMDRAHRIGQKKVVNVYRLITRGTLEEKIMSLQRFKIDVASTVVNQQNAGLNTMETDQILDLFNLGETADVKADSADLGREEDLVDETGNVRKKGEKGWLDDLPELSDERQYEEEFNLDSFLQTMQK